MLRSRPRLNFLREWNILNKKWPKTTSSLYALKQRTCTVSPDQRASLHSFFKWVFQWWGVWFHDHLQANTLYDSSAFSCNLHSNLSWKAIICFAIFLVPPHITAPQGDEHTVAIPISNRNRKLIKAGYFSTSALNNFTLQNSLFFSYCNYKDYILFDMRKLQSKTQEQTGKVDMIK